jgi:hypothetical protein
MYKLLPDHPVYGKLHTVQRLSDNAFIPFDPDNTDYQAYLKHIAEGGVVLPADDNEQTA